MGDMSMASVTTSLLPYFSAVRICTAFAGCAPDLHCQMKPLSGLVVSSSTLTQVRERDSGPARELCNCWTQHLLHTRKLSCPVDGQGVHSHSVGIAVAIHKVQELGLVRAVIDLGKDLFVQTLTQVHDSCGALSSCTLCMVHGHCHANTMRIWSLQASICQLCCWSLM